MADILTYNISYTLNGTLKTSKAYPICNDFSLSKDSSDYKNIISTSSKFTFVDNKSEGISDFTKIKEVEAEDIYTKIYIIIFKNNQWRFNMYFSPVDCAFDDDRCTCEVTPQFDDEYRCLFDNWEKEWNILKWDGGNTLEPVQFNIDNPANLELFTCTTTIQIFTGCPPYDNPLFHWYTVIASLYEQTFDKLTVLTAGGTNIAQWASDGGLFFDLDGFMGNQTQPYSVHPAYNHFEVFTNECFYGNNFTYFNPDLSITQWILSKWRIYKNKFTILDDLGGGYHNARIETTWCAETIFKADNPDGTNPVPATYTTFSCGDAYVDGIKGKWYGREPFYVQYAAQEAIEANTGNTIYSYFQDVSGCGYFEFNLKNPQTWGLASDMPNYRGRELMATLNYLLNKMNCTDVQCSSDCKLFASSEFFSGSNINPLTNEANPKYILNKCYDIKHPLVTDNPAMELFISFKKLLETICELFNCRWYIYNSPALNLNIIKIEHLHYFENNFTYQDIPLPTYDLTQRTEKQTGQKELIATDKYSYNIAEMYNTESWAFSQHYEYDFAKLNIDYDLKLNNGLKRNDKVIDIVTDVAGIITSPGSFSDDAVVLVACRNNVNNVPTTITEKGYRSKKSVTNGWCCLSNIFDRFYRNGRILLKGYLDGGVQEDDHGTPFVEEFNTTKANKLQTVTVRDCDGEIFFDKKGIKTNLGEGRILKAEYNLRKDVTKIEILLK